MSSIRKNILVGGNPHFVEVNSSLELEEVEVTGVDPVSGKTVHISMSSLLRQPKQPEPSPFSPSPMMFGEQQQNFNMPTSTPPAPSQFNMFNSQPSLQNFNAQENSQSPPSPSALSMFDEPLPAPSFSSPPLGMQNQNSQMPPPQNQMQSFGQTQQSPSFGQAPSPTIQPQIGNEQQAFGFGNQQSLGIAGQTPLGLGNANNPPSADDRAAAEKIVGDLFSGKKKSFF